MQPLAAYIGAAFAFVALDAIWLGAAARQFYFTQLAGLLRDKPDLGVAAVFYVIYLGGVVYFAVMPALASGGLAKALLNGAMLGFLAYATYDATNLATLKGYPAAVAIVDVMWGTFVTGAAAAFG
ncbi:MAG TPA: DUF2177 domain-containing protein, partial [Parvularcula sp.]|nr:DUF2177 domain-containing protein [Parvularcula sp.]